MKTVVSILCLAVTGVATAVAVAADYDILITNARIADGTGARFTTGSVAIKDGRVAAVGKAVGSATT